MSDIYRAVVIAHYSELPVQTAEEIREDEDIEFDYVNDKSVNSSATITSSPTVDKDYVSDHMYREPKTLNLSGKFSLNGFKATNFTNHSNRLVAIQEKFEEIQSKGIRCTIVTRRNGNNEDVQFKTRTNMYLQSISWTEKVNSVDFRFDFRESIAVNTDEIEYDENVVDDTLPALTAPKQTSLFGAIIDMSSVNSLIDKVARETGLCSEEFMNNLQKTGLYLGGIAVGVGVAAVGVVLAAEGASGPVGWIAAGVTIVGLSIWGLCSWISDTIESEKYRVEQFKLYDTEDKNKMEQERYIAFRSQIANQLKKLEDTVEIYEFATDENQETMLSIDDDYWSFEFIRDNSTQQYSCTATNYTTSETIQMPTLTTLTDISQLKSGNAFFTTDIHGWYVYIMCPILTTLSGKDYEKAKQNLQNYKIVIVKFVPEEFENMMVDIIKNAVLK